MSAEVSIVWISPLDESSLRIPFGQLVYNAGSLESLLRRAQIAVVLHKDEASRVFDYTDSEIFDLHISLANIKTYTSHIIHVHYRHPDIPWKATIVDLPGTFPVTSNTITTNSIFLRHSNQWSCCPRQGFSRNYACEHQAYNKCNRCGNAIVVYVTSFFPNYLN